MYQANKVLSLRSNKQGKHRFLKKREKNISIHPIVRKRRILYLCWMVLFLFWFIIELFIQQGRIWNQEEKLAEKQKELAIIQTETKQLNNEMKLLNSPSYLIELAHKLGYSKPEEENYKIQQ